MSVRDLVAQAVAAIPRVEKEIAGLGKVWLRPHTGAEADAFQQAIHTADGAMRPKLDRYRAEYVLRSLVEEDGSRVYRDDEVDLVGALPESILADLFEVAKELNGATDNAREELEKNSAGAPGGGSSSA